MTGLQQLRLQVPELALVRHPRLQLQIQLPPMAVQPQQLLLPAQLQVLMQLQQPLPDQPVMWQLNLLP